MQQARGKEEEEGTSWVWMRQGKVIREGTRQTELTRTCCLLRLGPKQQMLVMKYGRHQVSKTSIVTRRPIQMVDASLLTEDKRNLRQKERKPEEVGFLLLRMRRGKEAGDLLLQRGSGLVQAARLVQPHLSESQCSNAARHTTITCRDTLSLELKLNYFCLFSQLVCMYSMTMTDPDDSAVQSPSSNNPYLWRHTLAIFSIFLFLQRPLEPSFAIPLSHTKIRSCLPKQVRYSV